MNASTEKQSTPLVFFQLNKIDEAKRLVYGRAVQEMPDRVGEIFDYETSKPNFQAWAASQFDSSLGKSNGNVRAMHKDVAAGIVIPGGLTFNDADKAIDICAKITDDNEWSKVESGTYTGFSIGGKYAKKWECPDLKKTRYTADPSEISLVDRPCIPSATFFEVQKANGTVMQKNFANPTEAAPADSKSDAAPSADAAAAPAEVAKAEPPEEESYDIQATPEEVNEFVKLLAISGKPFTDVLSDLKKAFEAKPEEGEDKEEAKPKEGGAEADGVPDERETAREAAVEAAAANPETGEEGQSEEEEAAGKEKAGKNPFPKKPGDAAAAEAGADKKGEKKEFPFKADGATDLEKAGARNSKKDADALQKAHDALNAAGARCHKQYAFDDDTPPGNKPPAMDKETDVGSNAMPGAKAAPNDKAEPAGDLQKVEGERDELRKMVEALTKDVELLKAQPAAPRIRLRAVGKGEDLTTDLEKKDEVAPVKDDHGEVREAASVIKKLHQSGGAPLFKF